MCCSNLCYKCISRLLTNKRSDFNLSWQHSVMFCLEKILLYMYDQMFCLRRNIYCNQRWLKANCQVWIFCTSTHFRLWGFWDRIMWAMGSGSTYMAGCGWRKTLEQWVRAPISSPHRHILQFQAHKGAGSDFQPTQFWYISIYCGSLPVLLPKLLRHQFTVKW